MRRGEVKRATLLTRIFPFLHWTHLVNGTSIRADIIAGVTNAVLVLPQGVAFAMIAGLPPVYGLYSAMVPPIIAGLFGSSRHLISGPTTAISIVVFATVSQVAEPGSAEFIQMALTLTLLAGIYQMILGLVRMGTLINFISHSVVVGFTAGAAVLIATSQLKHYFGIHIPAGESFLDTWKELFAQIEHINWVVTFIATLTLVVAAGFMRFLPRWPGMLIAMVVGSLASLGFEKFGMAEGISLVGILPRDLPPLSVPDFSLTALKKLGSSALAIAMLGLMEAVSIARSIASKSGQRIDGNQEFIGQGLANIVGSFFSCYAASGSFTRSGLNYSSGAVTPMSAVFAAVSLMLIVLLVAPLAAYLPIAAMAGILLIVAFRLIDFAQIRSIVRTSKRETVVLLTTIFSTLFVELEFAIYVGIMLSLIIYLMRTSRPRIVSRVPDPKSRERHFVTNPDLPECPQLKIARIDGSVFFGAAEPVQESLHALSENNPEQKNLLIVSNGINFVDYAGAEVFAHEAVKRRSEGGDLYMVKVKEGVCDLIQRGDFPKMILQKNLYKTKSDALTGITKRLDKDVCATCDKRIFTECAKMPKPARRRKKTVDRKGRS